MERLDKLIKELHKAGAITSEEVAEYLKNKDSIHNLCITIYVFAVPVLPEMR